jgi:DNA-binding CsgD family transcriptional regulator/tetratricopeptide (TPR) repeat protein
VEVAVDPDERGWPFAARADELAAGRRALGARRGVLIVGEGGVGKSRLARELVSETGAAWHVLAGSPGAGTVRFGAWSHLLPAGWDATIDDGATWRGIAEHLAADGAVRLVVEDAHWLDLASAALLHHLVVSHGATAVVTSRSDASPAPPLTALWKDGHLARLDLDRLTTAQLDALLEAALGAPVEPRTVQRLHDRTGGNVLLARQLIEDARSDGSLELVHGAWVERTSTRPSPRLVDLLADRIEALAPDERAACEVVAVATPIATELLARAVSSPVVERLRRRGLVQVERVGVHRVARLGDPLMGEVLIDRLGPGRRDEVILALVALYEGAEDLDERDALRLAVWMVDLGRPVDPDVVGRAAELALARSDAVTAERLAAASEAAGGGPAAAIRRGEALVHQQRHGEADAVLRPVGDHLAHLDDDLRYRFATARALALSTEMGRLDDAISVLETVIATMAAGPARWALEAHLSFLLADCGRLRAAAPLAEPRLSRWEEDEPSALTALVAGGVVRTLGGRCEDTLALCEEMTPVALRHLDDRPEALGWIAAAQMLATYVRGDLHAAAELGEVLEEMATALPDPTLRAAVLMYRGLVLSEQGRLDSALRVLRQSAALHEVDNRRGYQAWCFAIMARAHAQRGELDDAREALVAARRHLWPDGMVFGSEIDLAAVWVEALGGDRDGAARLLADAVARAEAEGATTPSVRLRYDAVRAGLPAAPHVAALAAATADEQSPWVVLQAEHVAALAADDGAGLVDVGRRLAELGIHLQAAEALAQGAEAHRRAGSPTLASRAKELSTAEQALCEGAATPALRSGGPVAGLTGRELDVATRAAAGQTNQEIAAALGISVRTAETHLQRVFTKLGVHRRHELAALFRPT